MLAFHGQFTEADLKATLTALGNDQTFAQVGAMDGRSFDPIFEHVHAQKWKGILFEPIPDLYEKLKANYADCAERLTFINMAIADYEGLIEITRVTPEILQEGILNDTVLGISSIMLDRGVLGGKKLEPQLNALIDRYKQTLEVPCTRLPVALKKHGITSLDVLVIDTEGADWMVARQLDLDRIKPRLVYLEYTHLSPYERTACAMHFRNHGYRIFIDTKNGENFMAIR